MAYETREYVCFAGEARPAMRVFGAVFFAYFAYVGLFNAYAPLWLSSLGASTLAIGSIASLQSATRLLGPYAWGWLADRSGRQVLLLRCALALAMLSAAGLQGELSLFARTGLLLGQFLCTAAVVPLCDAALAQRLDGADGSRLYGRVRLWGSLGYAASVAGAGALLQAQGATLFPALVVVVLAASLLASLRLCSAADPPSRSVDPPSALRVLLRPKIAWLFAGMFLSGLGHGGLYAFFSLYLVAQGHAQGTIGLLWGVGVAAEVVWFWQQGRWQHRLSPYGWLVAAGLMAALRFAAIALFSASAWTLAVFQLTHAVTFAAQHTACFVLIGKHFPDALQNRGQALYAMIGYGISGSIAGVAGGALSERYGLGAVFWAAALTCALAAACYGAAMVRARRERS
jgi:PPP family 3-phenylpropionic acid transporter